MSPEAKTPSVASSGHLTAKIDPECGVVVAEVTDLHVGLRGRADRVNPVAVQQFHCLPGIRQRLIGRPDPGVIGGHLPSQKAWTRSRSALASTRCPIAAGCTE